MGCGAAGGCGGADKTGGAEGAEGGGGAEKLMEALNKAMEDGKIDDKEMQELQKLMQGAGGQGGGCGAGGCSQGLQQDAMKQLLAA